MGGDLRALAVLFLRLGFTAFGGPAAHVAIMEDEVVRRRGWLAREDFLDLLGAANLIPGPTSTELAIFIGARRAGAAGLVLGGVCFILPAALITLGFAWAYARFGALPQTARLLYGVKPVVIAVIAQALWGLGKTALKDGPLTAVAVLAAAGSLFGVSPLAILVLAGAACAFHRQTGAVAAAPVAYPKLFLAFLKAGSVVYGSGYVLLAFLRADLVDRFHWLTAGQLLDAVAVGQFTPGPVFTTATFIGYLLGGVPGAALATLGIFLPSFVFVAAGGALLPRLKSSPAARAFLDGVNAAALGLMLAVAVTLARAAVVDARTSLLLAGAAVLLLRFRVNSAWLILLGALAGLP